MEEQKMPTEQGMFTLPGTAVKITLASFSEEVEQLVFAQTERVAAEYIQ